MASTKRRPRARSRRRGGGSGGKLLGGVLILLAVSALGAGAWWRLTATPEAFDAASLCPLEGPVAQIAVLADMTDPVQPAQLATARALIEREIAAARPGTRITLGLVSPDPAVQGKPILSRCKPRTGADADALQENPAMIARRYREGFEEPFDEALQQLLSAPGADTSPIMESLQAFVAQTPGFRTFEGPRTLVIFSDLMQHGQLMSFYRGDDWQRFAKGGSAARLAHSLDGARVLILRIPRPNSPVADVDDFWSRYFDAQGAYAVRVETIGDL